MIPFHSFVGDEAAPRLAFILHGVLGAGHNLRSLAGRLAEARPEYRFVLLDLRYHGKSLGASAPHDLAACADDIFDLVDHLGAAPQVVIGHSLGGKVALEYGKRHESPLAGARLPCLEHTQTLQQIWTLDSDPGAQEADQDHQVLRILAALQGNQGPFASRSAAVESIRGQGFTPGLSNWLGTSLERKEGGFVWRFDLDKIPLLLADYFNLDFWPFLEEISASTPSRGIRYELLVAENSDRWSGSMKDRADTLQGSPRLGVHRLKDSGHWVHVDNPEGLIEIIVSHLS